MVFDFLGRMASEDFSGQKERRKSVDVRGGASAQPRTKALPRTQRPPTPAGASGLTRPGAGGGFGGVSIIDPAAQKADMFSRSAINFINAFSSEFYAPYSEQQLLGAYMCSVYMYAALRRVANLISRVRIVAEVEQNGRYVRLPENTLINRIFRKDGANILSRMWLNYAVYGAAVVYKVKTHKAVNSERRGRPIYDYKDGAMSGLYVLDKPQWDWDEESAFNNLRGVFVNRYNVGSDIIDNRTYLKREEFVYSTAWNPEAPNRGKPLVAIAIHEAVANAAIAQWMSEYFTRGAMPFIMVSMEEDPAVMTDADIRKYKRQFEEYWQGIGSSLRSVFFDRKVTVEQVGINPDDISAPELNETALEGISAAVGLDRELIVTPSGGSQERHDTLVKRAWDDTVIPLAETFLAAFNNDLGLPDGVRLVLDLSDISELDADREEKSSTEMSIFEGGLQSYNETRTRLKMPPVAELDGWYQIDDTLAPLDQLKLAREVPLERLLNYATTLWNDNLAKRSEVLALIGRKLPETERDGYKYDIENSFDLVQGLWQDDLLMRSQVLNLMGYELPKTALDGYRSELERGADYGEFITGLWADNLLTRSQTVQLLDMGITLPDDAPDGYADEIGDRKSNIIDLWRENLMFRSQAMQHLGVELPRDMIDGFLGEVESATTVKADAEEKRRETLMELWDSNLVEKSKLLELLGLPMPEDASDGFMNQTEALDEAKTEIEIERLKEAAKPPEDDGGGDDSGSGGGVTNWRSFVDTTLNPVPDGNKRVSRNNSQRNVQVPKAPVVTLNENAPAIYEFEDDIAIGGAEEDFLYDYGEYPDDPLTEWYGPNVALIESEVLPVYENYVEPFVDEISEEEINVNHYDFGYDEDAELEAVRDFVGAYLADEHNRIAFESYIDYTERGSKDESAEAYEDEYTTSDGYTEYDEYDEYSGDDEDTEYDVDAVANVISSEAVNDLYISLWFGKDNMLQDIQDELDDEMGNDPLIKLQDGDKFHLTLVYAKDVDAEDYESVKSLLPAYSEPLLLTVDRIDTFNNSDETVFMIPVESEELRYLQQRLLSVFMSLGIQVSDYSKIGHYNPHISLAFGPPDMSAPHIDVFGVVRPLYIAIGRSDYETVDKIPLDYHVVFDDVKLANTEKDYRTQREIDEEEASYNRIIRNNLKSRVTRWATRGDYDGLTSEMKSAVKGYIDSNNRAQPKVYDALMKSIDAGEFDNGRIGDISKQAAAAQTDVISELKAWEKASLRNGVSKAVRFETIHIPRELSDEIKSQIEKVDRDNYQAGIKSIFGRILDRFKKDNKDN